MPPAEPGTIRRPPGASRPARPAPPRPGPQSSVSCQRCGRRFTMYEPFWDLSLPLAKEGECCTVLQLIVLVTVAQTCSGLLGGSGLLPWPWRTEEGPLAPAGTPCSDPALRPAPPLPLRCAAPPAGKNSSLSWLGIKGTPASLQDCLRVFTADETLEVGGCI